MYNLNKKALFFSRSTITWSYFLFLAPVCGKITSPLKLQYWQPMWNYLDSIVLTSKDGFFLLISYMVLGNSSALGKVAEERIVNLGGWLARISKIFLVAGDLASLQKAVGSSINKIMFSLSNYPTTTLFFLYFFS